MVGELEGDFRVKSQILVMGVVVDMVLVVGG